MEDYNLEMFALQHSWEAHCQAFGPILEPAFAENPEVRIEFEVSENGWIK